MLNQIHADDVVGVLGLGAMGTPMARRLREARGRVVVHSRTRPSDLGGAEWAETARELAERADAILVMLPDLPQLEAALGGPDGLLAGAGDLLLMIGSTSSAPGVRALAHRLADATDRRVRVVDCPVSGGEGAACAILAGGNVDATTLVSVVRYGLTVSGRYLVVALLIPDRPGELAHIVGLIAAQRANVLAIQHHREGRNIGVLETEAELTLETRDEEHSQVVIRELAEAGYAVRRLR